mgnify:CR=1 FL=1
MAADHTPKRTSMSMRKPCTLVTVTAPAVALWLAPIPAAGQALPRSSDGKPDLTGVWQAVNTAAWDILPHGAQFGIPAGLGVVEGDALPYNAEGAAKQRENFANRATADPESKCFLPGVPRATYMGVPFEILQTPTQISMFYESAHTLRNVFMNTPHLEGPIEFWMGDSRGRWEGDTLVVDVTSLDDTTWLTDNGAFHSLQTRVVERIRRDGNNLHYEATVHDPEVLVEPWKVNGRVLPLMTNYEIEEAPHCRERDATELPIDGFHGNIR